MKPDEKPNTGATPVVASTLQPQVQEICRFIALGYSNREIAEMTGFTHQYVSKIKHNPLSKTFIDELMLNRNKQLMKSEERTTRLDQLRDQAYDIIDDTMSEGASGQLRLAAADSAVRAHKTHVDTQQVEGAPVFDSVRIAELLREKNTIFVKALEDVTEEEEGATAL